jgi:hypothetical protein
MKCPHCLTAFHDKWDMKPLVEDSDGGWLASHTICPECHRVIIQLLNGPAKVEHAVRRLVGIDHARQVLLVYPKGVSRSACPKEVPTSIAEDYKEACLVAADSPKASAALSRRCLQNVLRQAAKVKPGDLFDEIQAVLDEGKLPSQIGEGLDAVRAIGNFAAHPIKSKHTGEVIPVEPGEAEWNLDVLESLFDFYFVQPAQLAAKKAALNKKLAEAGKPPVK